MSDSANAGSPSSKSDIWIALGVIGCLALGATLTFVLSGAKHEETSAQAPKEVPRGAPIVAHAAATPVAGAPSTASAAPTTVAGKNGEGEFLNVTFDTLSSYYYEIPNPDDNAPAATTKTNDTIVGMAPAPAAAKSKDQIPAPIHALNGKKVSVQGFMIPIKLEKGATKEFLIVKDQTVCCWGRVPRMNEWVSVKMTGDRTTKFIPDQPVTIFGTLQVGEEIVKGEVMSIYRLDADDVAGPLDL